ncbi:MAG TPA: glycosyltransferase family 39 protein [Acetobacteraceae bacterium]|nr:glycosyltransferase family 39 protein [Acetobacteraceae bacterium]
MARGEPGTPPGPVRLNVAKLATITGATPNCHCEERSDAAIPRLTNRADSSGGGLPRRCAPRHDSWEWQRHLLLLLLFATLIRLVFAAALGLGVDESYMVASGRTLSLGYFDHPPASWWLAWAASHIAGTEAPIVVRLPFIALFALSTWVMARLGAAIADERSGFWAAVLLNLSPVFGVTTGTWVLPDGPLDCALLGAALCLVRALPAQGRAASLWWAGAGLCAGLALFSKYSAALTLAGAFAYLLTSREHRHWLARPAPYLAAALAVLVFSPVIAWNATHHWASFAFQGDRAAAGAHFHPLGPLVVLAGEALFVLPWIWAPMMALFVAALRKGPDAWRSWLLACLAAPPIVLFALIAAWSGQRVLFHWAAPGYLMLFPLLGEAVVTRLLHPWLRRTLRDTAVLVVLTVAVVATQVRFDWLHPVIARVARQDPDLEAIDWTSLRTDLAARGLLVPGTVVGVPDWRDAGKIAYALGPDVTVLCLNSDARQFGLADPPQRFIGQDVLLLVPEHAVRATQALAPVFDGIDALPPAPIRHAGRVLAEVVVLRAHRLRAWPPP